MTNYFRITAYNKEEDYTIIVDSYGLFDALWEFSSLLVKKGFSIFAIGNQDKFDEGNMPKETTPIDKIMLRSYLQGKPVRDGKKITVGDKYYTTL